MPCCACYRYRVNLYFIRGRPRWLLTNSWISHQYLSHRQTTCHSFTSHLEYYLKNMAERQSWRLWTYFYKTQKAGLSNGVVYAICNFHLPDGLETKIRVCSLTTCKVKNSHRQYRQECYSLSKKWGSHFEALGQWSKSALLKGCILFNIFSQSIKYMLLGQVNIRFGSCKNFYLLILIFKNTF